MDLSKKERFIIANQLKILEKLYPEEADRYSKNRTAIESGYKIHYDWITEHLYDEISEEKCKEVLDILELHRALKFSNNILSESNKLNEESIKFRGFDGNNETDQYSYVCYFILELGRFEELAYNEEYTNFNSHSPLLGKYRRMLGVWNEIDADRKFELSKDQIQSILDA